MDQFNKRGGPNLSSCSYSNLILDTEAKNILKKRQHLQQCWENWMSTCGRIKLDPYLSLCKKNWIQVSQLPQYETLNTKVDRRKELAVTYMVQV